MYNREQNENNLFIQPYSICYTVLNELFLYDMELNEILVYDDTFRLLRQFKVNSYINKQRGHLINNMIFDNYLLNTVYLTNTNGNKLIAINSENGNLLKDIELDRPFDIKISETKVYATSSTSFSLDSKRKKVSQILTGSNCIYILDKLTFSHINVINLNWLKPKGLYIDENQFICTTAYKVDMKTQVVSEYLYLYFINENGEVLKEFQLNNIKVFSDFLFFDYKLIFSSANCLKFIEIV